MTEVYNGILLAADDGDVTILCLLDLTTAFDTVDHDFLMFRFTLTFELLTGTLKRRERKRRERKTRHQVAGVEKARTENAAPSGRGGNGENGKRGTKVQGWKW